MSECKELQRYKMCHAFNQIGKKGHYKKDLAMKVNVIGMCKNTLNVTVFLCSGSRMHKLCSGSTDNQTRQTYITASIYEH